MKIAICLLFLVLVISIEAMPSSLVSRSKRGFRTGAADRFSHGFGKRTETDDIPSEENRILMKDEDLAALIENNPKLIKLIVSHIVDTNGDGFISRDEFFHPDELQLRH